MTPATRQKRLASGHNIALRYKRGIMERNKDVLSHARFKTLLKSCTIRQQEVIALYIEEDETFNTVADMYNITPSEANLYFRTGIKKIREALA